MTKIMKVNNKRFRSILDLELETDSNAGLISLCGQNNVGKTNTLRAINLFFNPGYYDISEDMPRIKYAAGGSQYTLK